jgi:hypothetical protein
MLFELGVAMIKLINMSISEFVIEGFCNLLNESSNVLERLLNLDFEYLFDFKEGIKLKTELIKLLSIVDPLSPNYVINLRLNKFKAKDSARGLNLYEDYSTNNLIHELPRFLAQELVNLDREYGKAQIGKS